MQLAIQSLYKGINSISFKSSHHLKPQQQHKCLSAEKELLSLVGWPCPVIQGGTFTPTSLPKAKATRTSTCRPGSPQQKTPRCFFAK